MKKTLLLSCCLLMLMAGIVLAQESRYSPSQEEHCITNGNVKSCTVTSYSGYTRFAQNSSGDWVDAAEVLSITKFQDDLTFHYNGIEGQFNLTFEAGAIYNGTYYSFSEVKQMKPGIQFDFPTERKPHYRKYAVNITNITLNHSLIESIVLNYKDHSGFQLNQLVKNNNKFFVKEIMQLGFKDLLDSGFTILINQSERRVYIGNLSNKFMNNSLYLDPTTSLTQAKALITDDLSCDATQCFTVGGIRMDSGNGRVGYIRFNISNITSSSGFINITESVLRLYLNDNAGSPTILNFTNSTDTSWTESNTPPSYSGELLEAKGQTVGNFTQFTKGSYYLTNLTTIVSNYSVNDPGVFAILIHTNASFGFVTYDSKDDANGPILNITYSKLDTYPFFSNNLTNSTSPKINQVVQFNITINDSVGLESYIFAWDKTSNGTFINESPILLDENTDITVSFNKTIDSTRGQTVAWKWYANNSVGNWNETIVENMTIVDTAPLLATILFPSDNSYWNYTPLEIQYTASDADSDAITYYFYIDEVLNGTTTGNWSFNASDGTYDWKVMASTSTSNSSNTTTQNFTIDTVIPSVNMTSPINATAYSTRTITLNFTVNEPNNSTCWFNLTRTASGDLEGNANRSAICNGSQSFTVDADSSYTLSLYVRDLASNINLTQVQFTTNQPDDGGGGGGGGGASKTTIIQAINGSDEVGELCGDGVCDLGERFDCPIDCRGPLAGTPIELLGTALIAIVIVLTVIQQQSSKKRRRKSK